LHLFRSKFLWQGVCYERLRVRNYGLATIQTSFSFHFEADFADIFEVRGTRRPRKGRQLEPVVEDRAVVLGYEGLDGVVRRTRLECFPRPAETAEAGARFDVSLRPQEEATYYLTVACERGSAAPPVASYDQGIARLAGALETARAESCAVSTSN